MNFIEIDVKKLMVKFSMWALKINCNELASSVKSVIGNDVIIKHVPTDDNRSYHVSSKKIWNELGFKANYNIEDAVKDLKNAFEKKILNNCLDDINYFKIKKIQNINIV